MPGIGIVFDIEALGGGYYGYQAWRIFMKHIDQKKITNTIIKEGDTNNTLHGRENDFCITIYGPLLDCDYIYEAFAALTDQGLAPTYKRFIVQPQLSQEPLPIRGTIDLDGYFIADEWLRIDHDLCKEAGWKYRPEKAPPDLPKNLQDELDVMSA